MPEFVLPALRYLRPGTAPRLGILWDGEVMLALGVFDREAPSLRFPFRRLTAVRSRHSFQSGVLLRPGLTDQAVDALLDGLLADGCRAIRFTELRADSRSYRALRAAMRRRGMRWFTDRAYHRSALDLTRPERWRHHLPPARHQRMIAQRRKLEELGEVSFHMVAGDDVGPESIDAFLKLEADGWKAPTALCADTASEAFFRTLCRDGARHLFFCELRLDGRVIASTANFVVAGRGFAFKAGVNREFSRYSPGLLVEYLALEHLHLWPAALLEIESGAQSGSYMDEFWPERVPMIGGHAMEGGLVRLFAWLRYAWRGRRAGWPAHSRSPADEAVTLPLAGRSLAAPLQQQPVAREVPLPRVEPARRVTAQIITLTGSR